MASINKKHYTNNAGLISIVKMYVWKTKKLTFAFSGRRVVKLYSTLMLLYSLHSVEYKIYLENYCTKIFVLFFLQI